MFESTDQSERLREAKDLFQRTISYWDRSYLERERASRFHNNTGGRGQWSSADLELLKEQGRPALTFNLGAKEVRSSIGLNQESALKAIAVPVGAEDSQLKDIVNALMDRVTAAAEIESQDTVVDLRRHVEGEANIQLEIRADDRDPTLIKCVHRLVASDEVAWDMSSRSPDRSDAKHVFRHKWTDKADFLEEYPNLATKVDELFRAADAKSPPPRPDKPDWMDPESGEYATFKETNRWVHGPNVWADKKTGKIRIVHLQYEKAVKKHWIIKQGDAGQPTAVQIQPAVAAQIRSAQRAMEAGEVPPIPRVMDANIVTTWGKETYWFEFIGNEVLYDDLSPEPFDGISILPCSCYVDWVTGEPYGMWRDMFDPQQETNKRYSVELHHAMNQASPGTDVEENALAMSQSSFETATKTPGSVRYFKDGKLATGVVDRQPPRLSTAHAAMMEQSTTLLSRISDGDSATEQAQGSPREAAFTVAMRHHKSKLSGVTRAKNWRDFQKKRARMILEGIVKSMPDHQIAELLSNKDRYQVQDGLVYIIDSVPGPDGQPQPQVMGQVPIRSMRSHRYDIDFDVRSENNIIKTMELDILNTVSQNVPIPPEMFYERLSTSRSEVELMKRYALETQRAAGEQAMAQEQFQQSVAQQALQIEALKRHIEGLKVEEQGRHNKALEALESIRLSVGTDVDIAELLLEAERGELDRIADILKTIQQSKARLNGGSNQRSSSA